MDTVLQTTRNEQKLAEKARQIIEYRKELDQLQEAKKVLESTRPEPDSTPLPYEESFRFGQEMKRYREKHRQLERQILKIERQISALEHQARQFIPVAGISIRVTLKTPENGHSESFQIEQTAAEGNDNKPQVKVRPL